MHPDTCCLLRQEIRGKVSDAMEAFARGNGSNSGLLRDHLRQRTSEDVPLSKDVHTDSERGHVSRTGSTSKRAVVSTTRPSSSGEPSDIRIGRLGSGRDRLPTMQRLLPGFESKSSTITRPQPTRAVRDDALRSFDLLRIGSGKKK